MLVAPPITNPFGIEIFFWGKYPMTWCANEKKQYDSKTKAFDFVCKNHGKNYKELRMSYKHHKSKEIVSPSIIYLICIQACIRQRFSLEIPPSKSKSSFTTHMKKTHVSQRLQTYEHFFIHVSVSRLTIHLCFPIWYSCSPNPTWQKRNNTISLRCHAPNWPRFRSRLRRNLWCCHAQGSFSWCWSISKVND